MKYTCIIVDDERPALKLLKAYIAKVPQLELVGACENALEAMNALQQHKVDILMLDIQMPELTGLDLLRIIKNKPQVILTTAYRDYAVEGFELDVTDYLVKPFSFERFVQAINKTIGNLGPSTNQLIGSEETGASSKSEYVFVKTNYKMEKLALGDIRYIKGMREYIAIHTQQRRYVLNQTMSHMEQSLPASRFRRVHKSYIVSLAHIQSINGNTIKLAEEEIPIGASYRKGFFEQLDLL